MSVKVYKEANISGTWKDTEFVLKSDYDAEISQLQQQLKEAESVIEFYGNKNNWCLNGYKAGSLFKGSLKDSEEVNDNETLNHIGGKLARQYLSRGE